MFNQIMTAAEGIDVHEERERGEDYCELVVYNSDVKKWTDILGGILGAPAKPAGSPVTREDGDITGQFGGVTKEQTLFKKTSSEGTVIAMFWPWQDGQHTTLKIAVIKK